jgi:hypothetical protein
MLNDSLLFQPNQTVQQISLIDVQSLPRLFLCHAGQLSETGAFFFCLFHPSCHLFSQNSLEFFCWIAFIISDLEAVVLKV